ncbi:PDZ and LIM domain protein 3 isoform X2 [Drosophila tropicalis]|uniref:PDZ and LIM domain protein 3 isoform X2 n=1 Tax=Drosophila tropicalis TaxID=46794 RepID=UPI0035ABF131
MSPKLHEFAVVLQRDGQATPWGIRLVGGNDLDTPLIITRVQVGSPSYGELLRGDIIAKIGEYDARDLSHADAQQLFRGAGNEIGLVVHRDNTIAYTQGVNQDTGVASGGCVSRSNSTLAPVSPDLLPHRGPSPFLPGPSHFERALQLPVDTLPQTVFPQLNASGGYVAPPEVFTPKPTRDHQQDVQEEQAAIVNQPYRTTPLVLPGAKVKKDAPTTESYLRHYPNPAVRAHPGHDYHDSIMKQRVADTMLHKVVGQDADTGRVFHKQFNSPIGLYSNSNIEDTIRTTVPYKKTVQYDPRNSETYRAIQEEGNYSNYGHGHGQASPQEVTIPVQTRVYQPNRLVPGKKPVSAPVSRPPYNVVNTHDENIRQSGSFNRLMYSVVGATDY